MISNLHKFLSIAIAAFFMTTAPTHAVLIDNGTFTTDTDTGLAWLDLTESTGFSFAAASAEFGTGGAFEGYRHATESELDTFLTNAGFASFYQVASNSAAFDTFINLVGITDVNGGDPEAVGHFDNDGVPGFTGRVQIFQLLSLEEDFISVFPSTFTDVSSATVGNFLVQDAPAGPVPEPSALAIFAIGFAGVALSRRRRLI
jgi:hypothetical protein